MLLCPTFPSTAPPHDTSKYWGYSAVYNALDYPGIVFPTGMSADAAVDKKGPRSDFIPDREDADKFFHDLCEWSGLSPCHLPLVADFEDR